MARVLDLMVRGAIGGGKNYFEMLGIAKNAEILIRDY
jgi:hypothetical protein